MGEYSPQLLEGQVENQSETHICMHAVVLGG